MDDSGVYAAAAEVREAIRNLDETVSGMVRDLAEKLAKGRPPRRDRWAGELFADLVAEATARGMFGERGGNYLPAELAARAWELVDALDAADPMKQGRPTAAGDDGPLELA